MVTIVRERPDHPQVEPLLRDLDQYLARLYPPEANHILDAAALLAPGVHFFVAKLEDAGDIVGCGAWRHVRVSGSVGSTSGLTPQPLPHPTPLTDYAEIKRMMVRPGERGRGVGARLLCALELDAAAHGLSSACLETGAEQVEAVRLYERSGYQRCAAFGGYPDNGLSLFFQKALGPHRETP